MMSYAPQFDELYALSDIHMGGTRNASKNFQIFNRGERLEGFIRQIAQVRPSERVALVLNGDIIDSLAEDGVPGYVALDGRTALQMMDHIYADPSFAPVWAALADFVQTSDRHLVFVVGNHDIELSLPIVEDSIRRRLADGKGEIQARIRFATHGSGFACQVGSANVFCTHGNEVDLMNWVDYNALAQLANAINAGRAVDGARWKPNAGTRLVVDAMNSIKEQLPFVDLLKPEVAAVASVLLALDNDLFKKVDLGDAFPIIRDALRGGQITKRLLGANVPVVVAATPEAIAEEASIQLLGPSFREAVQEQRARTTSEDDLLRRAAGAMAAGQRPSESMAGDQVPQTLGVWDVFVGWVGLVPKVEALRRALKDWLEDDGTFDVRNSDDRLFNAMKERVADSVDFVVTGHTHLARALSFKTRSYYYNCGTWIRTLRLTTEALDANVFEESVWPLLASRKMSVLDEAKIPGPGGVRTPLLLDRTNAVRISSQDQRVTGDLLRITDGNTPGLAKLEIEPQTSSFTVE